MNVKLRDIKSQITIIRYDLKRYTNRLKNATKIVKVNTVRLPNGKTIDQYNSERRYRDLKFLPEHIATLKNKLSELVMERDNLKNIDKEPSMVQMTFNF